MLSIGIGGNIGSGKTAVAKELVKLYQKDNFKVKLLDADSIAWKLYSRNVVSGQQSVMYNKIKKSFGVVILDEKDEIDRKKLGELVFHNKQNLQKINKIVHPELIRQLKAKLQKPDAEIKILDAALIFYWGTKIPLTYRILVTAPKTQKNR